MFNPLVFLVGGAVKGKLVFITWEEEVSVGVQNGGVLWVGSNRLGCAHTPGKHLSEK